ncbi:cupin domain-containing protein [Burkholderia sp. PAMC 26561]|uniref:cupin domain-containing protein n=2 Tax=Burkholderia sp. PAMC 26561 TaxID=1795043 RepID=UPI0009E7A9EC
MRCYRYAVIPHAILESILTIHRLRMSDCVVLKNPGKNSVQIVWPENAPDAMATITRVTMEPGAVSERHVHTSSEQIWIVERGEALLLLTDARPEIVRQGDIIRTPAGEIHGIENTGAEVFAYLAVTCPPENMATFYKSREKSMGQK